MGSERYSKISKNNTFFVSENEKAFYICIRIQRISDETSGEMAEWSNAAVLKTVDCNRSGGSNPSFSAKENPQLMLWVFYFLRCMVISFTISIKFNLLLVLFNFL